MITKVQSSNPNYSNKNTPVFKGGVSDLAAAIGVGSLRFLDTNPAIGATAVDLGSMVIPRTYVDAKNRGPQAGVETGFREAVSVVNHGAIGLVGLGAATLLSGALNKKYATNVNKLLVNNDAIETFSQSWKNSGKDLDKYYADVLSKVQGLDGNGWKSLEVTDELLADFKKLNPNTTSLDKAAKKEAEDAAKEAMNAIKARIAQSTGAKGAIRIAYEGPNKETKYLEESLDVVINTMAGLGKTFKEATAKISTNAAEQNVGNVEEFIVKHFDDFTKELKGNKLATALLGLAVPVIVGAATQPFNRYLTKKRTGKDGFVGVEGREPDKSTKFKVEKGVIAGGMGIFALSTIAKSVPQILQKIQFTSAIPTMNQFKLVYGLTIMGRILSSRDENELRESSIKDFLGFANWLILGGMVTKLTAKALPGGEDLINYVKPEGGSTLKNAWNWITKASVKSYDEVLLNTSENVVKDGKALGFRELFKLADQAKKAKLGKLALAQIAGYVYSGVVLGVGIAKLNISITNKINGKKKTEKSANQEILKFFAQKQDSTKEVFADFK